MPCPIVLAVLYSGLLAAAARQRRLFHGVRLLGPTRVTRSSSWSRPSRSCFAFIFLGEPIRPAQVVGGAIILAGVAADPAGAAAGAIGPGGAAT